MKSHVLTVVAVALLATVSVRASEKEKKKVTPQPVWQPMLGKSFKVGATDLRINGLVVDRKVGCVFVSVEGKGVYCSSAGANRFSPNKKTWAQVCKTIQTKDAKHRFALTDCGIKESRDGGATWSPPIPPPKGFVITEQTWIGHDAKHDVLYLTKTGGDLYKLARGK